MHAQRPAGHHLQEEIDPTLGSSHHGRAHLGGGAEVHPVDGRGAMAGAQCAGTGSMERRQVSSVPGQRPRHVQWCPLLSVQERRASQQHGVLCLDPAQQQWFPGPHVCFVLVGHL